MNNTNNAGGASTPPDQHKINIFPDTPEEALDQLFKMTDNPLEISEKEKAESTGDAVGMLRIKSANKWIEEASDRPNPNPLYLSLWYEGEACCLFADSNLGKSIFAVQIASEIAEKGFPVILFDFELSDKQFQLRYTDEFGQIYKFPENLLRAELDPTLFYGDSFEDEVITNIQQAAIANNAKILIIDNLTYLCNAAEKGDAAGLLMMRLMDLKKSYGLSILVLAHTPKRPLTNPITQNDLAGSKKIFNFFDSCFAIGRSAKDDNSIRYIKQIKSRAGAIEYGANNVLTMEIVKSGNWLHFRPVGASTEKEHLCESIQKDKYLVSQISSLYKSGKSVREIAKEVNVSKTSVSRALSVNAPSLSLSQIRTAGTGGTIRTGGTV